MSMDRDASDDLSDYPEYYTQDRLLAHSILSSAQQMLNYRSFLARNANRTIEEIRAGGAVFESPVPPMEEQNLIRALHAEIIQETISNIEALAAVSMNPAADPEERAKQLLTYRNPEIHRFFASIDEDTSLDRFAGIFSYPDVAELEIAEDDEQYYRQYMEGNLEAYREFFLIAKDVWDLLKDARDKITHGFFVLLNEDQQLVTEYGETADLPNGCDDYLATADWDEDEEQLQPHILLTGERPRTTYLTICRNAAVVQNHILQGLKRMIENQGEPVFPEIIYGADQRPDEDPSTTPDTDVITVDASYNVVLNTDVRERQEQLFDDIDQLVEVHGS